MLLSKIIAFCNFFVSVSAYRNAALSSNPSRSRQLQFHRLTKVKLREPLLLVHTKTNFQNSFVLKPEMALRNNRVDCFSSINENNESIFDTIFPADVPPNMMDIGADRDAESYNINSLKKICDALITFHHRSRLHEHALVTPGEPKSIQWWDDLLVGKYCYSYSAEVKHFIKEDQAQEGICLDIVLPSYDLLLHHSIQVSKQLREYQQSDSLHSDLSPELHSIFEGAKLIASEILTLEIDSNILSAKLIHKQDENHIELTFHVKHDKFSRSTSKRRVVTFTFIPGKPSKVFSFDENRWIPVY
jgi:hypothetical protein